MTKKILIALVVLALLILAALQFSPLPAKLTNTPYATMLLARDGSLLGATIASDQQWRFAPVDALPKKYVQAVLRFEDRRFFNHFGIDPLALVRATWGNIRAGKVTSGASTITMQLARLLRDEPPRNLLSKLIEAGRAFQLEWRLDKENILIHYTSHAPYGGNIVGLRAAAWRYFGRAPEHLSWAESALLAVLPNSPALIHPGRQRDVLKAKRDRLLKELHQQKYLNDLDLELALLEPLPEKPHDLPQAAPHVLTRLKAEHPTTAVLQSSIDARLQQHVNTITEQHGRRLASEGIHNIALVLIDHHTMETRAYVGNQAWKNAQEFSPQVDIAQRPRSTGSILKPLLYGLMLQDGELLPSTLIPDVPTQYAGYNPQNFDRRFRGAVPARFALAHSLNVPAVRMLHQYGISRFHHQLQAMGMTTLFRPADDYGLTLILGGAEGNLWELTSIYAQIAASARQGQSKISDAQLLMHSTQFNSDAALQKKLRNTIVRQGAAWLTLQAMIEVVRPGNESLWRDFSGSQTIAWKTGTSYGLRDAWAIGSNSRYTVGVWAGNAGGESATSLSGQSSAAPILFDVFDRLGAYDWFERPEYALKTVQVCLDDGYLAGGQCAATDLLIPAESHFQKVTPFHRRIHTDASGHYRVHSQCESVTNMQSIDWFVLPAAQEYFWRQYHSEYRSLPPWRKDCLQDLAEIDNDQPMDLLYPHEGSRVYIPVDLNGKRSRVIVRAVHRSAEATLLWHIDDRFLGQTKTFHEQSLSLEPGWHTLLLLDQQGYRLERKFKVLGTSHSDS